MSQQPEVPDPLLFQAKACSQFLLMSYEKDNARTQQVYAKMVTMAMLMNDISSLSIPSLDKWESYVGKSRTQLLEEYS